MSTPVHVISDELVLAAIERAERHRTNDAAGVPMWAITDHLDIPKRSGSARHVRSRLRVFEASGALKRSRSHGVELWTLTAAGRRQLQGAIRGGTLLLPESPQHRAWRRARAIAAEEIERFGRSLRKTLDLVVCLLDSDRPVHSDTWFDLAEQLHSYAWQMGSATHCLYEWAEPDDAHADIDDRREPSDDEFSDDERARRRWRRISRRNTWMWGSV